MLIMTPNELSTWHNLNYLNIDDENSAFSFSDRLAKENNWTKEFAKKAIFEYKKFVFLAKHAGHPVTPSLEVDEVWHLHLIYTRSYWDDMCKAIDFQLHHGPTKGGKAEGEKFNDWYNKTKESYEKYFGPPSKAFWPDNNIRFAPNPIKKVDTSKFFIFKKPTFNLKPKSILFCLPLFLLFMDLGNWIFVLMCISVLLLIRMFSSTFKDNKKRYNDYSSSSKSSSKRDSDSDGGIFGGFFGCGSDSSSHSGCGSDSGCGSSCGSSCGGGCGGD